MPPMLEEAFNYNGYTYFVFESCGKTYRDNMDKQGITNIVIGRVCGFTSNFIYK